MDRLLATAKSDLIVLDIMMPGEDGLSICKRLQETLADPDHPADGADREHRPHRRPGARRRRLCDQALRSARAGRAHQVRAAPQPDAAAQAAARQRTGADSTGWRFDFARKEMLREDDVAVRLSSGEHLLLVSLIEHAGIDADARATAGPDARGGRRSCSIAASTTRSAGCGASWKPDPRNPRIIVTQWGGGYVFAAEVEWVS